MATAVSSILVSPKSVTDVSVPVCSQALIRSHKVIREDELKLIVKVFNICKIWLLLQKIFRSGRERFLE